MIDVSINRKKQIEVEIVNQTTEIDIDILGQIVQVGDYDHYQGDYTVTPKLEKQILQTEGLVMDSDVEVKEIPVHKVSNLYGGQTIIIGG